VEGHVASGFKINKSGIARMTRELQREFDKHPIRVPVHADQPLLADGYSARMPQVVHYHGPVVTVNGDGAQVAWNNNVVNQEQSASTNVTDGFEDLARVLGEFLLKLPAVGLEETDRADAEATAQEMLAEVTAAQPDTGKIRRGLQRLKGVLAPVAIGAGEEAGGEIAKLLIGLLGAAFLS
jgi:hypothetical protein